MVEKDRDMIPYSIVDEGNGDAWVEVEKQKYAVDILEKPLNEKKYKQVEEKIDIVSLMAMGDVNNGEKIFSKSNVSSDNKPDEGRPSNKNDFEWNIPLDVSGLIILKFENMNGSKLANVEFPLVIDRKESQQISSNKIPEWVKNTAGWWATNQIPDSAFVNGIEFLVKEEIIVVPIFETESMTESSVPEWIKTNAGWWADGQIDDKTFATGIEFLIKIGLIVV